MTLLGRAAVPFEVVLTKADLLKPAELEALEAEVGKRLERQAAALPYLFATSSRERQGSTCCAPLWQDWRRPAPDRSPQP